jgi:solute:Na+ symporter, SSS family
VTLIDWSIVALYIAAAIGIGAYFTKRAAASTTDFFVAGRSLPWIIAGTSIVATTYSSDTPLFVAGMSRNEGIYANWFWWSAAIGNMAAVFFFSRLWRRTEAVTDVEFVALRYNSCHAASGLRGFKALFDGIILNCVVMASVTKAMTTVITVLVGLSDTEVLFTIPLFGAVTQSVGLLILLGSMAVIYTALSGLYGVVYTDLIQFALAMIGSVALAGIVYVKASDGGLMENLAAAPDFGPMTLRFFPSLRPFDMAAFTFVVYISVAWWGGAPGSGYLVQRLLATRSEKDALLANLWFALCHYVLRPWPWILVGLLSMIYFPGIADAEKAYPEMIGKFMPIGLKGVMVASLLAAFMSTLDTHLNWGASYLINDFYRPFVVRGKGAKHYVRASRICMVILAIVAIIVGTKLTSILEAYKYLGVIYGGVALVMIARWYWWRVNAWSEISALLGSLVIGNMVMFMLQDYEAGGEEVSLYAVRLIVTLASVTIIWLLVTFVTSKKPSQQAMAFYRKMRIRGPGWRRVARETGVEPLGDGLMASVTGWISGSIFLYSALLGIGKTLFHEWAWAGFYGVMLVVSGAVLWRCVGRLQYAQPEE